MSHSLERVHLENMADADNDSSSASTAQSQHLLNTSEAQTETLTDSDPAPQNLAADIHIPQDEETSPLSKDEKQPNLQDSEASNKEHNSGSHSETSLHSSQSLSTSLDEDHSEWTLLSLPGELLLEIFDYLDARQVIRELSLVCKAIHSVVSKNLEWKVRFRKRCKGTYPVVPGIY